MISGEGIEGCKSQGAPLPALASRVKGSSSSKARNNKASINPADPSVSSIDQVESVPEAEADTEAAMEAYSRIPVTIEPVYRVLDTPATERVDLVDEPVQVDPAEPI